MANENAKNRYELNKELAQMLKGRNRQESHRKQAHVRSWHWKESRRISVRQAVLQE